jgi:hypothetical protein
MSSPQLMDYPFCRKMSGEGTLLPSPGYSSAIFFIMSKGPDASDKYHKNRRWRNFPAPPTPPEESGEADTHLILLE